MPAMDITNFIPSDIPTWEIFLLILGLIFVFLTLIFSMVLMMSAIRKEIKALRDQLQYGYIRIALAKGEKLK